MLHPNHAAPRWWLQDVKPSGSQILLIPVIPRNIRLPLWRKPWYEITVFIFEVIGQ